MNYNLFIGKYFCGISLEHLNYYEIIELLGEPTEEFKEIFEEKISGDDYSQCLFYNDLGITIYFNFDNGEFINYNIASDKVVLDGIALHSLKKNEIFQIIAKYSRVTPDEAFVDFDKMIGNKFDESFGQQYSFDDIGVVIWFNKNKFDEISVNSIEHNKS